MAENLYEALFQHSIDGIALLDGEEILRANPAFCNLFGYAEEDLKGKSPIELLHPDNRTAARQRRTALLAQEASLPAHRDRALHRDGHVFWIETTAQSLRLGDRRVLQTIVRDVTEAVRVEQALRESELRYRGLFDSVPIGLYRTTPEGRIVEVNPALVEMLGYPDRESLLSIHAESGYADAEARRSWCERIEQKGTIRGHEAEWKRHDGSTIWVEEYTRAIRDESGKTTHYEGSAQDISARRAAEQALVREKALFEQLFSAAPEAIVLCDPDSKILRANEAFARLFGYCIQEAFGANIDLLIADTSSESRAEAHGYTQDVAQGRSIVTETVRYRKDGTPIEVSILGHPIRVDQRQIGVYGIYRDITKRKQMERALEREKAFFEQLFSGAPEAVVLCDNDMRILRVNREFSKLFGFTNQEAVSRNLDELIAPASCGKDAEARDITARVTQGELTAMESVRRHKDGSLIDVSILAQPIAVDGEQVGNYGIYRDISDRKRAERALSEAHSKVEQLHQAAELLEKAKTEVDVYAIAVQAAERILGFPHCAIDAVEKGVLVTKAMSSEAPKTRNRSRSIAEAGAAGEALQSGIPTLLDPPTHRILAETEDKPVLCLLTVPIQELGVFQAASEKPHAFSESDIRYLGILLGHTTEAISRIRLEEKLKDQATRDPLTGVFNRRHFNEVIEQEVRRAKRYDHPLGLLMIDVDKFKHINDHYGHQAGDMVLQSIARILRDTVRETDVIVRYGGDEFLVVLTETAEECAGVARRMRAAIEGTRVIANNSSIPVSISIGTAAWNSHSGATVEEALAEADEKMYEDKRLG